MIDDEQYSRTLALAIEMKQACSPDAKLIALFLAAILSEVRTVREIANDTNDKVTQLADQFNMVSAGGNSLIVETAR